MNRPEITEIRRFGGFGPWIIPALLLLAYSIALIAVDATQSRDFVRIFFTDIGMPYKEGAFAAADGHIGYGVNTTLSAFFFASAAVMLFFAALAGHQPIDKGDLLFILQACVLLYLALDDRFMIHERLGGVIGIYSSLIILLAMIVNLAVYAICFHLKYFSAGMILRLGITGSLAVLATAVDFLMPLDFPIRLSLEDLLKLWVAFGFLVFAWETARFRLIGQPSGEASLVLPDAVLRRVPGFLRARLC